MACSAVSYEPATSIAAPRHASLERRNSTTNSACSMASSTTRTRSESVIGSPSKDACDLTAEPAQKSLDSSGRALLEGTLMDRTQGRRHAVPVLEVLGVRRTPFDRLQIRLLA